MEGEVVSTHIKVTENTTVAKMGIIDQVKLLLRKFSNDDAAELNAVEKLSASELRIKASLMRLFDTAVEGFETGQHTSVTLSVSSRYLPYLDEVIDDTYGMGRFYDFTVHKKDLPPTVEYKFIVEIRKKVT